MLINVLATDWHLFFLTLISSEFEASPEFPWNGLYKSNTFSLAWLKGQKAFTLLGVHYPYADDALIWLWSAHSSCGDHGGNAVLLLLDASGYIVSVPLEDFHKLCTIMEAKGQTFMHTMCMQVALWLSFCPGPILVWYKLVFQSIKVEQNESNRNHWCCFCCILNFNGTQFQYL